MSHLMEKSTPVLGYRLLPSLSNKQFKNYSFLRSPCMYVVFVCPKNWGLRQTSYDVARLLLMAPIEPWQNSTPIFGAVVFCTINIEDFRTPLMSTSSTILQKMSLRWTSSKRKMMEVIEVDQLEDTNNESLLLALPHSGLKPKNNHPKEEDDLRW